MAEEKVTNPHFAAYFDKEGQLIGAERLTDGKKGTKSHISQKSWANVSDIRELSVIMIPGNSPCCIKQGTVVFCWCS